MKHFVIIISTSLTPTFNPLFKAFSFTYLFPYLLLKVRLTQDLIVLSSFFSLWSSLYTLLACMYAVTSTIPTLCDPTDCNPPGLCPWDSPGANTGMGCHAHLQGIFLIQGSNSCIFCLLHWQVGSLPLVPPEKPHMLLR